MRYEEEKQPERFRHSPLDLDGAEIRLLKFAERSASGPIECSLETFPFGTKPRSTKPRRRKTCITKTRGKKVRGAASRIMTTPYRALSYTWGPPTPQDDIVVNGAMFAVRENLYHFLQILVEDTESCEHYYWIDQICIDQSNILERNHTVARMSDIYSMATEAVVWLGHEMDDSGHAFDILSGIIQKSKRGTRLTDWSWDDIPRKQSALSALLTRKYWDRLWIVQELNVAGKVVFWCGRRTLDMGVSRQIALAVIREFFGVPSNLSGPQEMATAMTLMNFASRKLGQWNWWHLLERFGKQRCSDLRDRVFGLQGLVQSRYRTNVDYSLSPEQVLLEVLAKAVRQEPRDTVCGWLDMRTPAVFADALFGPEYSCGVLMVLQSYLWPLILLGMFKDVEKGRGDDYCESSLNVLKEARTLRHRKLAKEIRDLETRIIESGHASTWKEVGRVLASKIDPILKKTGFCLEDGGLQHRDEISYGEMLSMVLRGYLSDNILSIWMPRKARTASRATSSSYRLRRYNFCDLGESSIISRDRYEELRRSRLCDFAKSSALGKRRVFDKLFKTYL